MKGKEFLKKNVKRNATRVRVAFFLLIWFILSFLPCFSAFRKGLAEEERVEWTRLSSFRTYFSLKDGGRCENIAIAASLIDGIVLQPYGDFSFNETLFMNIKLIKL